jgi:hypothetical protein
MVICAYSLKFDAIARIPSWNLRPSWILVSFCLWKKVGLRVGPRVSERVKKGQIRGEPGNIKKGECGNCGKRGLFKGNRGI